MFEKKTHETVEIQEELFSRHSGGKAAKYRNLILGRPGFFRLLQYELIMLFCQNVPGALGLLLRSRLYPALLGGCGRNVTFGRGVVIRHPHKIFLGDDVVIDAGCVLDAKGQNNRGILLGSGVFIGRNTILNCKNGDIIIGDRVNISSYVTVFSASEVRIGNDELIAAYAYLVGGTHNFDDPLVPVLSQGRSSLGITVVGGGWLGAHVTVFDGVKIGKNAVIGAGAAVHRTIPDYAVAAGNPVTIINKRKPEIESAPAEPVTAVLLDSGEAGRVKDVTADIGRQENAHIRRILIIGIGRKPADAAEGSGAGNLVFAKSNEGLWDFIRQHTDPGLVYIVSSGASLNPDSLAAAVKVLHSRSEVRVFCKSTGKDDMYIQACFAAACRQAATPFDCVQADAADNPELTAGTMLFRQ